MWPVDDIFVPPVVITWLCRDTISARTVVGHSLLLARLPRMSDDLRDPELSTDSFRRLLKTRLFSEYVAYGTAH